MLFGGWNIPGTLLDDLSLAAWREATQVLDWCRKHENYLKTNYERSMMTYSASQIKPHFISVLLQGCLKCNKGLYITSWTSASNHLHMIAGRSGTKSSTMDMSDLRVCWPVLGHSRIYFTNLEAPGPARPRPNLTAHHPNSKSGPGGKVAAHACEKRRRGVRARGQSKWSRKRLSQASSGQCPRARTSADDKQRWGRLRT